MYSILLVVAIILFVLCLQVELVCRVATLLLQTHHDQLVTTPAARPVLTVLKDILYARIKVIIGLRCVHRVLQGEWCFWYLYKKIYYTIAWPRNHQFNQCSDSNELKRSMTCNLRTYDLLDGLTRYVWDGGTACAHEISPSVTSDIHVIKKKNVVAMSY